MKTRKTTNAGVAYVIFAATLAAIVMLAACTTEETRNRIDQTSTEAQQQLTQARQSPPNPQHYDPLVVSDKVWSGNSAFRMHRGLPLPARYETMRGITVVSSEPMPLAEIAAAITAQTGIPVRVMDTGVRNNAGSGPNSTPGNAATGVVAGGMPVSYEGPLSGLLEKTAGYFNVDWRYDGTSVNIMRLETHVFMIEALPQIATIEDSSQGSSSTSSGGSGGSSGGSGGSSGGGGGSSGGSSGGSGGSSGGTAVSSSSSLNQNMTYNTTIKYWDELKETLTAMLGGTGSVIVSPSSGEVTVTTTPEVMHTIATYLAQENKRISRQIAINVEVFSIDLSQGEDYNFNPSLLLEKLGNVASVAYTSGGAPATVNTFSGALGSLSVSILNPRNGDLPDPAKAILQALSLIGDVSQVAQFPMVTLNNRPVSRFVGTSYSYVPNISSNTVNTTTTSTSETVNTATINAGFTIQLTPRLLDDGRIMMQYSLDIAGTPSFQFFNSCTGLGATSSSNSCPSVQLPTQSARTFIQQSVLRSGSTLMIGGIDQEQTSQNAQGVGSPFNPFLGGGTSNGTTRTMVFMAITPQVLDDTLPKEQGL